MKLSGLLTAFSCTLFLFSASYSQTAPDAQFPVDNPPKIDQRGQILGRLGLSPDQLQQIKELNKQRRPQNLAAQKRLTDARRALDEAIYSDNVDIDIFRMRMTEFREAQGEVARLRYEHELNIRNILTAEQLVRFRELRKQFSPSAKPTDSSMRNAPIRQIIKSRRQ